MRQQLSQAQNQTQSLREQLEQTKQLRKQQQDIAKLIEKERQEQQTISNQIENQSAVEDRTEALQDITSSAVSAMGKVASSGLDAIGKTASTLFVQPLKAIGKAAKSATSGQQSSSSNIYQAQPPQTITSADIFPNQPSQNITSADIFPSQPAGTKRRAQVTGHRSQVTGHRSQDTGHRLQGIGHRLQGTGHRSQKTQYKQLRHSIRLFCFISGYATIRHMLAIDHAFRFCTESKTSKWLKYTLYWNLGSSFSGDLETRLFLRSTRADLERGSERRMERKIASSVQKATWRKTRVSR